MKKRFKFKKTNRPTQRKYDKYTKLWTQIHERFKSEPKLPLTEAEETTGLADQFFVDDTFVPTRLAETIKNKFAPMVYVEGCFYHYDPSGLWKDIDEHQLGKFASAVLGSSARTYRIEEAIKLLSYDVSKKLHEFEPAKGYINLQNGMLNIKSGKLQKHLPKFNSRIQLPYSFDRTAKCPRWKMFLQEVFAEDIDKAETLQQWFGYCLTSETFLQMFMIFKGSGGNGKTVTLNILERLVGKDNICAIPLRKMERDFVLITLKDKLVNLCGEVKTSKLIDSDVIKLLTGEDTITVDVKYRSAITFQPVAKHIFSTNEMPKFRDKTEALRRRAIFLTFDQQFRGSKRDAKLSEKLAGELSGILCWALEGWKKLSHAESIYESPSSLEYKERFAETLNPVFAFINHACKLGDDGHKIKRATLYDEYRSWHRSNIGDHPLSKPSFFERVRDDFPQIGEVRVNGTDYFTGVRVLKPKKLKLLQLRGKEGKRKT